MPDSKTLSSYRSTNVDTGFGSRHFTTLTQKLHKCKSGYTRDSIKTNHTANSSFTRDSVKTVTSKCNVKNKKSKESRERDVIMEVLPYVKEYYRMKSNKLLKQNPMYNSSEQIVFYDNFGKQITGQHHDISKNSHEREYDKEYCNGTSSSPVTSVKSVPSRQKSLRDWRKFFEKIPNAVERRRMEQIRREMEEGKLKPSSLPTISYFAEDLPMLPGEAGTRLLQTVRIREKVPVPGDGRHRIEPVPGKLCVHTQNEFAGLSNFGILQMQWTTGVPISKGRSHPPQRISRHYGQKQMTTKSQFDVMSLPASTRIRQGITSEIVSNMSTTSSSSVIDPKPSDQYEWEFPLLAAPARNVTRNERENYYKCYTLLKKKLHLHTSQQNVITSHLPELFVKKDRINQFQVQCLKKDRTNHLLELFVKNDRTNDNRLPELFVKKEPIICQNCS